MTLKPIVPIFNAPGLALVVRSEFENRGVILRKQMLKSGRGCAVAYPLARWLVLGLGWRVVRFSDDRCQQSLVSAYSFLKWSVFSMSAKLVRSPIYQQLHDQLRQVLGAEYEIGQQFLTEREVSQKYGVSRTTANKTISSLVSEGLLEFRKGIGTFVRCDAIGYDLQTLISFSQRARSVKCQPPTC